MADVKKQMELTPSKDEYVRYGKLVDGTAYNLVLVACSVEGRDRFAIGRMRTVEGKPEVEPLAIVLNDKDAVHLRSVSGELLPVEASCNALLN